jgi:ATP-dependent Clp protease protease subunit
MLLDYPGNVTVKIDGIAASAASVIAMAGTPVLRAPTAFIFMHNPLTVAMGEGEDMLQAYNMLAEVKEAIMNAYELKSGLPRDTLSDLMDSKTWLPAHKAISLGFADGMIQNEGRKAPAGTYAFSYRAVTNSLLDKLKHKPPDRPLNLQEPKTPVADLDKRLALLM